MSSSDNHDDHTGPIKTPKQVLWVSVLSFVLPVFIIIGLVSFVTSDYKTAAGSDLSEDAVAARITKVGTVEIRDTNAPARTGEQIYQMQCAACHATGAAGAPKFADAAAWGPRLGQGLAALTNSAMKGKNAMPAQAGGDASDAEIAKAVVYMANAGGGKFTEPAAAPAGKIDGAALYKQTCAACHDAGVSGAPKLGDKAAWAPRLAQGQDGLTASAIKGKNAMPAKGGSAYSDEEMKAVVAFMTQNAK